MKHPALAIFIFLCCTLICKAQTGASSECPKVSVDFKLQSDTLKYGQDVSVFITLTNQAVAVQDVWFDKPKQSTGGPAWTVVQLTNKRTGLSVLKYQNKAVLSSQVYSAEQINEFSYQLKPGERVSGQFSLYNLVVLLNDKENLDRGDYEMQVYYCSNASDKISFSVR